jgi:hypothetical protein
MGEDTIFVREVVLSKLKGLIRDRTYSVRLYSAQEVRTLLSRAGFENIQIITDFSPHPTKGDYGCMNFRMIAVGRKN